MNGPEFADLLDHDAELQSLILGIYTSGFAGGAATVLAAHGMHPAEAMQTGTGMQRRMLDDPAVRDELTTTHLASLRDREPRLTVMRPQPLEDEPS